MAEIFHLPHTFGVSFCFAQAKVAPKCVVWRGEEKGVRGKGCEKDLQVSRQKFAALSSKVALVPVKVGTGGSSAAFQHWENNHQILTNPSDLCLISKTLLVIKRFQNIYVIDFSPKFYSLQRKWQLDNVRNSSKHCHHELNSSSFFKGCSCLKAFFSSLKYLFQISVL